MSDGQAAEHEHPLSTEAAHDIGVDTVEALVRRQLSTSLGGKRGMLEAAVPGVVFTATWLIGGDLKVALVASLAVAGIALVARLVQRSTTQYVFNAIFGLFIGWLVVQWASHAGATEDEQRLLYYLPGILISLGYTVVMGATCLVRWPMLGFMLGAATEDPLGWHENRQVVRLCSRLTWVMLAPGAIGVLLQGPVLLLGLRGAIDTDAAVWLLLALRSGLGWVLRFGSFAAMIWLLARNATPLEPEDAEAGAQSSG